MLQNAYLFAKIGADTAENERNFAENLQKIGNYPTGPKRVPLLPPLARDPSRATRGTEARRRCAAGSLAAWQQEGRNIGKLNGKS